MKILVSKETKEIVSRELNKLSQTLKFISIEVEKYMLEEGNEGIVYEPQIVADGYKLIEVDLFKDRYCVSLTTIDNGEFRITFNTKERVLEALVVNENE